MSESKIEWTERTWNPIVGCSILTPGCTNCYAMKMAARLEMMGNASHYAGTTKKVKGNAVWTGKLALAPDSILLEPLRRKKPATYFVNSMGDLFHEDCPDEWIDKVFAVMALAPQHTFQVLTKRAERMRKYVDGLRGRHTPDGNMNLSPRVVLVDAALQIVGTVSSDAWLTAITGQWPLPNVWLGVSAERQQEADERIPHLLQTSAAIRFVSAEPLLGPIDLRTIRPFGESALNLLDWIIVGGESGPNARPMHPDWARSLRDQCDAVGVAYFFKQWGEFAPREMFDAITSNRRSMALDQQGDQPPGDPATKEGCDAALKAVAEGNYQFMSAVGKKAAGRLLDGIEHNAMPARAEG